MKSRRDREIKREKMQRRSRMRSLDRRAMLIGNLHSMLGARAEPMFVPIIDGAYSHICIIVLAISSSLAVGAGKAGDGHMMSCHTLRGRSRIIRAARTVAVCSGGERARFGVLATAFRPSQPL
jgi:hypothetical protein